MGQPFIFFLISRYSKDKANRNHSLIFTCPSQIKQDTVGDADGFDSPLFQVPAGSGLPAGQRLIIPWPSISRRAMCLRYCKPSVCRCP